MAFDLKHAGLVRDRPSARTLRRIALSGHLSSLDAPILEDIADELEELSAAKDQAYLERNQVVALLARCCPAGTQPTAIPGWHAEWNGCVYIDLPTGQASWHYHDSHAWLFSGLPPYPGEWDGHTTEEKYARIERWVQALDAAFQAFRPRRVKAAE